MSSGTLSDKAVIELSLDDMKLKDDVGSAFRDIGRIATEGFVRGFGKAGGGMRLTGLEMQKIHKLTGSLNYITAQSIKLKDAEVRSTIKLTDANKNYAKEIAQLNALHREPRAPIRGMLGTGLSRLDGFATHAINTGLAVGAAGTGLAFGAAHAAGSTTYNTLTGSLRMLELAAGGKTQSSVLRLSKGIQDFSKSVERAPVGAIGGYAGSLAGAALGFGLFGPVGGLVGAIGGGLAGHAIEKSAASEDKKEALARSIYADKSGATYERLRREKIGLEKVPKGGVLDKPKLDRIKEIDEAIRLSENKDFREGKGKPLTSGLGAPGTYSALGDVRQQAQLAGFDQGALELANAMKELNLNIKVLNQGMDSQEVVKPKKPPCITDVLF